MDIDEVLDNRRMISFPFIFGSVKVTQVFLSAGVFMASGLPFLGSRERKKNTSRLMAILNSLLQLYKVFAVAFAYEFLVLK